MCWSELATDLLLFSDCAEPETASSIVESGEFTAGRYLGCLSYNVLDFVDCVYRGHGTSDSDVLYGARGQQDGLNLNDRDEICLM